MNSLEAIEKLRIRPEQEAQQCIEIFRSFVNGIKANITLNRLNSLFGMHVYI